MLTEIDKAELQVVYADAKGKADALQSRIKDEMQQAAAEQREPYAIQPLTGIRADLLLKACGEVKSPSDEQADFIGAQRAACKTLGKQTVYVLSVQLANLLSGVSHAEV